MKELEKTTFRISEITLQITELENEIATAKKKCDEATEKEMEVNEVTALQDFDKIQLSKIIEKVFIYGPGRMEINWNRFMNEHLLQHPLEQMPTYFSKYVIPVRMK